MFTERVRNDDLSTLVEELTAKLVGVLDKLLPLAPAGVDQNMVRALLLPMVGQLAEQVARKKSRASLEVTGTDRTEHEIGLSSMANPQGAAAPAMEEEEIALGEIKPLLTPAARYKANLAAIKLAVESDSRKLTKAEIRTVRGFSGWGGLAQIVWAKNGKPGELSDRLKKEYPAQFPKPDSLQLLWEYYTPEKVANCVADLMAPRVQETIALNGVCRALEPSAGVGRFLTAFEKFGKVEWTTVEQDEVGKRILAAAHPKAERLDGFFEQHASRLCARPVEKKFNIIVANPPYDKRGKGMAFDHAFRAEDKNVHYFLKRATYAAAPGCWALFIIPTGTLSGGHDDQQELRKWLFQRWHLVTAYRLPGSMWDGGASIATDAILLQRRGGMINGICGADEELVKGNFFRVEAPQNILGREVWGEGTRYKDQYGIVGDFNGFPPIQARPMYEGTDYATDPDEPIDTEIEDQESRLERARGSSDKELRTASSQIAAKIAKMLRRFDRLVAEDPQAAAAMQGEIVTQATWFLQTYGDPTAMAGDEDDISYLVQAFKGGELAQRYKAEVNLNDLATTTVVERVLRYVAAKERGREGATLQAIMAVLLHPPEPTLQPSGDLAAAVSASDNLSEVSDYLVAQGYLVVVTKRFGEANIRKAEESIATDYVLEWEPANKVVTGNIASKARLLQQYLVLISNYHPTQYAHERKAIAASLKALEAAKQTRTIEELRPEPFRQYVPVSVLQAWLSDEGTKIEKWHAEKQGVNLRPYNYGSGLDISKQQACARLLTLNAGLWTVFFPENKVAQQSAVAAAKSERDLDIMRQSKDYTWTDLGYGQRMIEDEEQAKAWKAHSKAIEWGWSWRIELARTKGPMSRLRELQDAWKEYNDPKKNLSTAYLTEWVEWYDAEVLAASQAVDEAVNARMPRKYYYGQSQREAAEKKIRKDLADTEKALANSLGGPSELVATLDQASSIVGSEFAMFLGYMNNIGAMWTYSGLGIKDERELAAMIARLRDGYAENAFNSFQDWLARNPEQASKVEVAYADGYLGFVEPPWNPIPMGRWDFKARTPAAYQWKSANKLVTHRGGLTALDVGLGKTTTALLATAMAKQQGLISRACYVVPAQTLTSLERDFMNFLPDYRIVTVGKATVKNKKGEFVTRDDTREQRLEKYRAIARGDYEVAIFTYETFAALNSTREQLEDYADNSLELQRLVARREEAKAGSGKAISENDLAKGRNKAINFVMDMHIRHKMTTTKDGDKKPLPEVVNDPFLFTDLGFDLLVVDEAQNFKSLYAPVGERTKGVPKFMNIPTAFRPWNLDLRCYQTRKRGGMAFFMSATPAKNSPLELFNMIMMSNPRLLETRGLADTEAFIRSFCKIEEKEVLTQSLEAPKKFSVVTGFRNLGELQDLLREAMELVFVEDVADQMILKVPEGTVTNIEVDPQDDFQGRWLEKEREELRVLNDTAAKNIPDYKTGGEVKDEEAAWNKVIVLNVKLMRILNGCVHPYLADRGMEDIVEEDDTVDDDEGSSGRTENPATEREFVNKRLGSTYAEHFGALEHAELHDLDIEREPNPPKKKAVEGEAPLLAKKPPFRYPECKAALAANAFDPATVKFRAILEKVKSTQLEDGTLNCGHIIFSESTASHACIEKVLIDGGINPSRIKVMNALLTPTPVKKDAVSRAFCGAYDFSSSTWTAIPSCDVVIANSVAYEGINLQTRTCQIHHADLPWNPAILQQRNGRGVRQGNTLTKVEIFFYVTNRSPEGLRLANIVGKRGWLVELIKGNDRSTNNPFDDASDIPAELLVRTVFARNEAEKQEIIAEAKREAARRAAESVRAIATTKFKTAAAVAMTLNAGKGDKVKLREELELRVAELLEFDENALPQRAEVPLLLSSKKIYPYAEGVLVEGRVRLSNGEPYAVERVTGEPAKPTWTLGDASQPAFMFKFDFFEDYQGARDIKLEAIKLDKEAKGLTKGVVEREVPQIQRKTEAAYWSAAHWSEWLLNLSEQDRERLIRSLFKDTTSSCAPVELWEAALQTQTGSVFIEQGREASEAHMPTVAVVALRDGVWVADWAKPFPGRQYGDAADWVNFSTRYDVEEQPSNTGDTWTALNFYLPLQNGQINTFHGEKRLKGVAQAPSPSLVMPRNLVGAATFLMANNRLWEKYGPNERRVFDRMFQEWFGFQPPSDWRTKGGASIIQEVATMRQSNPSHRRSR